MRYSELTEDNDKKEAIKMYTKFGKKIKRDCQSYLSQVESPFKLFRGLSERGPFITKQVRLTGRQPLAMDHDDYTAANDYFQKQFGAPFRNSMMATGDMTNTWKFGNTYIVYPIGNFEFVWSPEIDDLNYGIRTPNFRDHYNSDISYFLSEAKYTNKNLEAAIESGNEIMIRCKKYYGFEIYERGPLKVEEMYQIIGDQL